MTSILKTASGVASWCGSNVSLRVAAAAAMVATTAWLGVWLWSWALSFPNDNPGPLVLVILLSLAFVVGSLVNMAIMVDAPPRWTMERMTGYTPFVIWRAMTSDGRVTALRLLVWPLLVPAETLVCLWLAIGWLFRLLNVDLSK